MVDKRKGENLMVNFRTLEFFDLMCHGQKNKKEMHGLETVKFDDKSTKKLSLSCNCVC